MDVVVIFVFRIILASVFAWIGEKRKVGSVWGFVLTFFLGLVGIIIVLCSKKTDCEFIEVEKGGDQ